MKEKVMDLIKGKDSHTKLKNVIRIIKDKFEPDNVGDTLEGFLHFETVDKNQANLIVKTGKDNEFSDMELFLLGASAYLHDLLKPSSAWGLISHGGKVMKATTDKPELYGLDNRAEAIAIGWISAAHSRRSLDNTEWGRIPEEHSIGAEDVGLRKLAAIFLLADTLDTTTLRAPEMMRHIHYPEKFPDEKTEGKWMARQSITGWYIKEGKIVLQAYPKNAEEREAVLRAKTMMEEDLSEVKPMLKSFRFPCELKLEMQDILLKEKAVAEIHEATPFKGMDFYGESDAELFKGREEDVRRVEDHIYTYSITLFAGGSGTGKTSLILAGLFPELKISGWECIYLRPFGDLSKMVGSIKRGYGMEAESLAEAFGNLDEKMKKKILVVVDQFEEVLNWHAEMLDELILDFCSIYGLGNPKLLVVLRSDALCDLNRKIFKKVMTNGFPTVELGALSREGARDALNAGFKAGKVTLHPPEFIEEILNDLIALSSFDEIYPPYLQMVAEEVCKQTDKKRKLVLKDTYYKLGRAREIVARYLFRKIDEFDVDKEKAIKILKSLVSYAGRRAQKSVSEIEAETGIANKELEELLRRLVNARMIRKLDGAVYEIIHDHFGELVNKELVGEKERHIKYLMEQLNAAIDAFERNKVLMHCQIYGELYRYRKEIPVDESAYKILMAAWCAYKFPVWYWQRNAENKKIVEIAIQLLGERMIEGENSAVLLTKALKKQGDLDEIRRLLTHENKYIRGAAANAIAELVSRDDLPLLRDMLKDENWSVRGAAANAIAELVSREDLPLLRDVVKDENSYVRGAAINAITKLGSREDLPLLRDVVKDENSYVREAAVNAITKLGSRDDLPLLRDMLKDENWNVREAAVNAITKLGSRDDLPLLRDMLKDENWNVREAAVNAIVELGSRDDLPLLRDMLKDEYSYVRGAAINAIVELVSREDLPLLRDMLKDEDTGLREAAANAIVELGNEEDLDMLSEIAIETCAVKKSQWKHWVGLIGNYTRLTL
jgi:HEAT repeat protein